MYPLIMNTDIENSRWTGRHYSRILMGSNVQKIMAHFALLITILISEVQNLTSVYWVLWAPNVCRAVGPVSRDTWDSERHLLANRGTTGSYVPLYAVVMFVYSCIMFQAVVYIRFFSRTPFCVKRGSEKVKSHKIAVQVLLADHYSTCSSIH